MRVEQENRIPANEILKSFFDLLNSGVAKEVENAVGMLDDYRSAERHYEAHLEQADASAMAASFHRRMLIGVGMAEISSLPKDLLLFSITLPAHQLAEMASGVACESGRLLEIQKILEEEDVEAESYRLAENESERILEGIFDTVFTHLMQVYGHVQLERLYEMDRAMYDICCEVGRRLVNPVSSGIDHNDVAADIRARYGPEFMDEFQRRLCKNGL